MSNMVAELSALSETSLVVVTSDDVWKINGALETELLNLGASLDALAKLKPDGIDLSSGVEKSPGDKDLDLVARLFEHISQYQ